MNDAKTPLHEKKWHALQQHVLPLVPQHGWQQEALLAALTAEQHNTILALFPQGISDMLVCLNRQHQNIIEEHIQQIQLTRTKDIVAAAVLKKAQLLRAEPDITKRTTSAYALYPQIATQCAAETIDGIWRLAKDTSQKNQWAYYSKRTTLAFVYTTTLVYSQKTPAPNDAELERFIANRLANIHQAAQYANRITRLFQGVSPKH